VKNLKIEQLIRVEDKFLDIVKMSFIHNSETILVSAEFDVQGNSNISQLKNIQFSDNYNTSVDKNIEEKLNSFFWEYLDKENSFLNYHYTGAIKDDSYSDYKVQRDISKYPVIHSSISDKLGETITFRQSGEKNKYVKKDDNDEIIRDSNGLAVYLNEEEMLQKGLNAHDTSVVAFNEAGESIGLASDEWGADGIWINSEYQKRGVGTRLLECFRSQFKESRKIGQMTPQGIRLVRSLYRKNNLF
jgi:GNAT superfamily N-acetyltransferase